MSAAAVSSIRSAPVTARSARPRRPRPAFAPGLTEQVILDFVAADDVRSGMTRVVGLLRREGGAARVEWWAPTEDCAAVRLETAEGGALGRRFVVPAGAAGVIVLTGDRCGSQLMPAVRRLAPLLARRFVEEQLAGRAGQLARRNEALEDFAALVAHELKAPLLAASQQEDVPAGVACALDIVDELLALARCDGAADGFASPVECLDCALDDLGQIPVEIVSDLPGELPFPSAALRLLLRNLVANAVAAGARHLRVAAAASAAGWTLVVDDDGFGLEDTGRYAAGSGLGFRLCGRVAARFGAELGLAPRVDGGTRATLTIERGVEQ